jgi:hypothetical protein
MSANDGAMTARKPKSMSAQTACSRDEPQPKFGPPTRICGPRSRGNSGQSWNSLSPSPVRPVVFKNRAGMMRSVSRSATGSTTARERTVRKGVM